MTVISHRIFCCLVFSLCHAVAVASPACPGNGGEGLPADTELPALATRLETLEQACHQDAGYLAYRGAVLIQLGQHEIAASFLERALLIAPDHAGAQADYARALAHLGDRRAARSIVTSLLAREDVPAGMRTRLEGWQQHLEPEVMRSAWQTGGSLTLRVGGETNLNSAPARSTLDLTLPEGVQTLPLASSYRAKRGGAAMTEANVRAERDLPGDGRLQWIADVRGRHVPNVPEAGYWQYETLAIATVPVSAVSANQFSFGLSRFDYDGEHLYQARRLGVAHIRQMGTCLAGVNLDLETRTFPTAGNLDGRFGGGGVSLRCPLGGGKISLLGRAGVDHAVHDDRPGGNQQRRDLRLGYSHPLAGGRLDIDLSLGYQIDETGYSTLLEQGARRHLTKLGWRTEWVRPLGKGVDGLVTVETIRQNSNLSLFETRGTTLWLGGRWSWGD